MKILSLWVKNMRLMSISMILNISEETEAYLITHYMFAGMSQFTSSDKEVVGKVNSRTLYCQEINRSSRMSCEDITSFSNMCEDYDICTLTLVTSGATYTYVW